MARISFLIYLVLAGLSLRAAVAPASARLKQVSQEAGAARDAGRTNEAVALYRRGVALQPGWAEGWWNLGTLQYDLNAFVPARDAFAQFVKLQPDGAPGWALRGLCEFELKQYPASLDHLQRAMLLGLEQNPQLAKVTLYHAALLLTKSGHFPNAMKLYSMLASEAADDRDRIVGIGLAGLRLAMFPQEVPAEREAFVYRVGHAIFADARRQEAEARREFQALIAENPRTPELHNLLAQMLVRGDPDAAITEWKNELSVSPGHTPAKLQLAFEYLKRGEPAAGLPYAREAVSQEPNSFVAHNALGRVLLALDDMPGGIAELEAAKGLAPDSPDTRFELASAYAKAGRNQDAMRERAEFLRLKKRPSKVSSGQARHGERRESSDR